MLGIDKEIVQNNCMSGSMEPVKNYTKISNGNTFGSVKSPYASKAFALA